MKKQDFGTYLSCLRKTKGLSQRQLAELADITNSTISRIESNLVTPDLETIQKLSLALEVDKSTFLSESGYLNIPEDFTIFARKTEEVPEEMRAQMFYTLNETVDTFLKSLKEDSEED